MIQHYQGHIYNPQHSQVFFQNLIRKSLQFFRSLPFLFTYLMLQNIGTLEHLRNKHTYPFTSLDHQESDFLEKQMQQNQKNANGLQIRIYHSLLL